MVATVRMYKFFRDVTLGHTGVVLEGEIGENEDFVSVLVDPDPSNSAVYVTTVHYA
jgi:hypothetical protein